MRASAGTAPPQTPYCWMSGLPRNSAWREELQRASSLVEDRNTPLFVYCYSGARSSYAVSALRRMGYQQVTNIGGINRYRGKVEF